MNAALHLELSTRQTPTSLFRDVTLRRDGSAETTHLWYEIVGGSKQEHPSALDGFVFAVLLYAMKLGTRLVVHGPMSRSALYNIEDIQSFWHLFRPELYKRIDIVPETIVDLERRKPGRRAIAAFSGGVDSTFTALRHKMKLAGTGSYNLDTVLMVHGFDVNLANADHFDRLIQRTEPFLTQLGVALRIIRTNSKELNLQNWEDSHGLQLAACLHLLSEEFEFGLIGSTDRYDSLYFPWGTSPTTDHLLSGDALGVVHDGAGYSRTDKIAALLQYPFSVSGLRVCWEGKDQFKNCGVCEKCIRTRLNFLAAGQPHPTCFEGDLDLTLIDTISLRNSVQLIELQSIADFADANNIDAEWVDRAKRRLKIYRNEILRKKRVQDVADTLEKLGLKGAVKAGLRAIRVMSP